MSTHNIRLGLIGAGRMGSFHGLTAARHIPGACLAAIADPVPGQAARLAAELGVDKAYTDPQQLLDDPDIDGVLIVPQEVEAEVIETALAKASTENVVCKAIDAGMSATEAFATYGVL